MHFNVQANVVNELLEKLNDKVGISECHVSDIKELIKAISRTSSKIEDHKQCISLMEEKLDSIKNETLNVEGEIFNIL